MLTFLKESFSNPFGSTINAQASWFPRTLDQILPVACLQVGHLMATKWFLLWLPGRVSLLFSKGILVTEEVPWGQGFQQTDIKLKDLIFTWEIKSKSEEKSWFWKALMGVPPLSQGSGKYTLEKMLQGLMGAERWNRFIVFLSVISFHFCKNHKTD